MKEVVMEFPDIVSLSDFILDNGVSHIEVHSSPPRLRGGLTDELIALAEIVYGGYLVRIIPALN